MTQIRIDRGFVEVTEGQIHYRTCGPDNGPVLVMVHGSPGGSRALLPLMRELGKTFKIYAPDTLGNADSSPGVESPITIPYLADGMLRAMSALGLKDFYLYGTHTGGNIGIEAAIAQPQRIKRFVIDGVGLYSDEEKKAMLANHAPEIKPDLEGRQLNWAWHFVRDGAIFWPWWRREAERVRKGLGLPSADSLHESVLDVLKAIKTYHLAYRAALGYDKRSRMPLVKVPTLVACGETDMLRPYTEEAAKLIPGAKHAFTADLRTPEGIAATCRVYADFLLGR
ncbi:MAG: alpha/beta hydrolase [Alphaproteobacteria bacterium]|nr:alpha/beta hydrolase [Alphaproteobacteria bacterium]